MVFPVLRKWAAKHLTNTKGNNGDAIGFLVSKRKARPRAAATLSYRPMLEMLEKRTVPSSPDQIEVRVLSLAANDLVYDAANQMIYASVPSSAGFGVGNSITAIDPNAGTIGRSVFAGSEPTKLAISDNGQFIYVGLNGADAVARFNVPGQNVDLQFSLPTETRAEDIAVVPGSPESVAVTRLNPDFSPGGAGTAIYDDGIQRPSVAFPGDSIAFASPTILYAYDDESTAFQFVRMMVTSDGLTTTSSTGGLINQFNVTIKFDSGLVYSSNGRVIDPQALKLLGTYNASGSFVPDSAAGRTYFLSGNTLQVFDQATFTPIESFTVPAGDSLIRWGANGLAYRTGANQVILINLFPLAANPVHASEGSVFNGTVATFSDSDPNHVATDFTATIDWGDGSTSPGMVSGSAGNFTISGSHTYAEEGIFPVNVQLTGPDGTRNAQSTATVSEADLTVSAVPFSVPENQPFSGFVATFSDPGSPDDASVFSATILWGDGSSSAGTVFGSNGNFIVSASHTYNDDNNFQFTVIITEAGSPSPAVSASATASASETDMLAVTGTTITPTEGRLSAQTIANFSDTNTTNTANDFFATIDWGDGGTSSGIISGSNGVFMVAGSHAYAEESTYAISVTVTDDGSGSAIARANITANVADAHRDDIMGRVSQNGQIWTGVSTGSSFSSFMRGALDPTVTWVDPVVGDFNGDGRTDVAARDANTGAWWVGLSNGSSFTTSLWTFWSTAATWADVQVGDFNGDGKADIVGRYAEAGQWWVALSNGSGFTNSRWDTWSTGATWVDVKVGDFDGDGKADITGRYLQGGSWWTGISTGSSFTSSMWAAWSTGVTWVDVQVGDFNGDGKSDITGRASEIGQWWTGLSTGSSFNASLWTTWSTGVTWVDVKVGDFNGDGKDDIIGRALESGQWWAGISTGSTFTNSLWSTWSTAVTWVDVQVGDFNGDGKSDITGRALESGQWWTGISNGTTFSNSLWATWSTAVTWTGVRSGDFA